MKCLLFLIIFFTNITYSNQIKNILKYKVSADLNSIYQTLEQYFDVIESNITSGKIEKLESVPVYKSGHKKIAEVEHNEVTNVISVYLLRNPLQAYIEHIKYTPYVLQNGKVIEYYNSNVPMRFSYWNCDIYILTSKETFKTINFLTLILQSHFNSCIIHYV